MKELRAPTIDEIKEMERRMQFSDAEKSYLDDVSARVASIAKDYEGAIFFFINELENIPEQFRAKGFVKRRLQNIIGRNYEGWATFGMGSSPTEGGDYLKRSKTFARAARWYQRADETLGFLSDYALRQAESYAGAAHYRILAGRKADKDIIEEFIRRSIDLPDLLFKELIKKGAKVIRKDHLTELDKVTSDKKIISPDGTVYLSGDHSKN